MFGAHQLTEAFVWWRDNDRVGVSTACTAVWVHVAFAYVVLPVLGPLAVLAVEPHRSRRRAVAKLAVLGCAGLTPVPPGEDRRHLQRRGGGTGSRLSP